MNGEIFVIIIVAIFLALFMFFLGIIAGTIMTCVSMKNRLGSEIQDSSEETYLIPGLWKARDIVESFLKKFEE